jgi:hypothetical protein
MRPGTAAMLAKLRRLQSAPPPEFPPASDWRPIEGFPHFAVSRDKVVMTCIGHSGWPCPWRPAPIFLDGSKGTVPSVHMRDAGRVKRTRSVAKLYRLAFEGPAPMPAGPRRGGGDDSGDDDDDRTRGMPTIGPAPKFNRAAAPPETLPSPARPPEPARPPAPLARPRDVAPPGGSLRLGFHARGEEIPQSKLVPAKVAELKRLRAEGWSAPRLAGRYGISVQSACNVINGKTWRHIEPAPPAKGGTA